MSESDAILLYSRADCPLCEEGLEKVEALARRYSLRVEKFDIGSDATLLEAHRARGPGAVFLGKERGWGRLSGRGMERELRRALGG